MQVASVPLPLVTVVAVIRATALVSALGSVMLRANARRGQARREAVVHEGSIVTPAIGFCARSWPRYWRGDLSTAAADARAAIDAWSGEFTMYLPSERQGRSSASASGQCGTVAHPLARTQ